MEYRGTEKDMEEEHGLYATMASCCDAVFPSQTKMPAISKGIYSLCALVLLCMRCAERHIFFDSAVQLSQTPSSPPYTRCYNISNTALSNPLSSTMDLCASTYSCFCCALVHINVYKNLTNKHKRSSPAHL
jgi:hypothetical protein